MSRSDSSRSLASASVSGALAVPVRADSSERSSDGPSRSGSGAVSSTSCSESDSFRIQSNVLSRVTVVPIDPLVLSAHNNDADAARTGDLSGRRRRHRTEKRSRAGRTPLKIGDAPNRNSEETREPVDLTPEQL